MKTSFLTARSGSPLPADVLRDRFGTLVRGACDAEYLDSSQTAVAGVSGLPHAAPVVRALFRGAGLATVLPAGSDSDLLLAFDAGTGRVEAHTRRPGREPLPLALPEALAAAAAALCRESASWAGSLDDRGRHAFDPRFPSPGPHFGTNLLLGDRIGFDHPLQTTPKSVVDAFGRGSFRSHAATQVLATRWDLRQEENGFPANRQFYLTEDGRQVLYTGWTGEDPVESRCVHAPNLTTLTTVTRCGVAVRREIFLAPQEPGLPLACEVQQITLENRGGEPRNLRLVYTGMFGPSKPGALMEDVLYSTIILQAGMLRNDDGSVLALAPDYCPVQDRDDLRFQVLTVHRGGRRSFPGEFGTDYREFVGQGTLERPDGVGRLSNRLSRKGPGFFALAVPVPLAPGETVTLLSFTGLVSSRGTADFGPRSLADQVSALVARYDGPEAVQALLERRDRARERHESFLRLDTGDRRFDAWANHNLPFQVYYQTFVSRSFCQTQKGYREIGFREIQDLFASMAPFCAEGRQEFVEDLLGQWAAQVYEFGYANHNFYWVGKEPGLWSDDALWLVQAVARYVDLTGRTEILGRTFPVAGRPGPGRTLLATLEAVVRYSGRLSVGPHGLPLLDRADWNDCLKVDTKFPSGAAKEAAWKERNLGSPRLAEAPLPSEGTESVMNAFLLKLAADELARLAVWAGNPALADWSGTVAADMAEACRRHAWKGTWYARLLVNRPSAHPVVGVPGDGLATDGTDGSLFINSFSWAVLSGTADEAQIAAMYPLLETRLKTVHGYRLVTAHDLRRVEPTVASAEYFPGDRENGAVFKHASLMAVLALFEGASKVADPALAASMAASAWAMVDLAAPPRTLDDPFVLAGNPRFCTQYNNSETGENVGPLLSGTASWSTLALRRGFGLAFGPRGLDLDPLLRPETRTATVELRWLDEVYRITFRKPEGFFRTKDAPPKLTVDGRPHPGLTVPRLTAPGTRRVEVDW